MNTVEMIKKALNTRDLCARTIATANSKYDSAMDDLKFKRGAGQITQAFYDAERARITGERESTKEQTMELLSALRDEYHEAVDSWALPSGDKLDTNTAWLLEHADITAEQYNRMMKENQHNYTMYSVIRKAAERKRAEITEANRGKPLNQQTKFDLDDPIQSPESRKYTFDTFILGLESSLSPYYSLAVDPAQPNGARYASAADKLNAHALRALNNLQPMEDEQYNPDDFPSKIEEGSTPKVW